LSLRELRAIAQPPAYSPGPLDGLYRACSIYVSIPLARLGATPNGITVAWIVLGLAGAAMLVPPVWWIRVVGAVVLNVSYLLDFVDGEVARLTDRRSKVGGYIDLVGHGLIKTALPLAAGMAAAVTSGEPLFAVAGALAAIALIAGDSGRFYAACTSGDLGAGDLGHSVAPARPGPRRITVAKLVGTAWEQSFESPGLYGLTLVAAVAGRLDVLTLFWLVAAPVWFVQRTRQYCRRLRAEDAAERPSDGAGRARVADDRPEGKTVAFQRTPVHDPLEGIHNTA
jgi:phosphatidylglycerophosphate synthase